MTEPAPVYTTETAHHVTLMTQRQIAAMKQQIAGLVAERDLLGSEVARAHRQLDDCTAANDDLALRIDIALHNVVSRRDSLLLKIKAVLARSAGMSADKRDAAATKAQDMIDRFMAGIHEADHGR